MNRPTINFLTPTASLANQIYAALMGDKILKKETPSNLRGGFREFEFNIGESPILFRRWYLSQSINRHDWSQEPNIVRLRFVEEWQFPIDSVMPIHTTNVNTIQDAVNAIHKLATGKAPIRSFKQSRIDYLKIAFDVSGTRI